MAAQRSLPLAEERPKSARSEPVEAAARASAKTLAASSARSVALQAAMLWLSSRVALVFFTYFAVILNDPTLRIGTLSRGVQTPGQLIDAWARWDAAGLLWVARYGYTDAFHTAWFPLYPLLTRAVGLVLGQAAKPVGPHISVGWAFSGLIVSNLAMLGAFVALALLTYRETGSRTAAWLAPLVLAAYPFSFYLSAPYADGLFLALSLAALLAARQRWWALAAGAAYLAALTRNHAVLLVLPLLWEYGRQHGWWSAQHWRGRWSLGAELRRLPGFVGVGVAAPAGIATYMAYLWLTKGSPTLFAVAERQYWTRELSTPWWTLGTAFRRLLDQAPWSYWQLLMATDLGLLLLMAVLTLLLARRLPFSFSLYMVGLLVLCVLLPPHGAEWPDVLAGTARYLALAFPVFLGVAQAIDRRPAAITLVLGTGLMVGAALTTFYLSFGWLD